MSECPVGYAATCWRAEREPSSQKHCGDLVKTSKMETLHSSAALWARTLEMSPSGIAKCLFTPQSRAIKTAACLGKSGSKILSQQV